MKYEIIIEIDDEIHIVKVLNHFDEIAPTILMLMHKIRDSYINGGKVMEFKTRFQVGDEVRRKVTYTKSKFIRCPFCGGIGYIVHNGQRLECDMCDDGQYELIEKEKVWSKRMDVVGATIRKSFILGEPDEKIFICVQGTYFDSTSVKCYPEDELILANEAEEGDPA